MNYDSHPDLGTVFHRYVNKWIMALANGKVKAAAGSAPVGSFDFLERVLNVFHLGRF